MPPTNWENELGEFLRARRDLISPRQAGLPEDGQRRVAGLRREEMALLAGVSADYYTRWSKAWNGTPPERILDAIAGTLHLEAHVATQATDSETPKEGA